MKSKLHLLTFLNLALILSLSLAGCSKSVLDVQIVTPGKVTPDSASPAGAPLLPAAADLSGDVLGQIQPIALSFLAGGVDDRQPFLQYQTTPCSNQPNSVSPPCTPGEHEGQTLQVFPLGADQPDYLRPEDVRQRLDFPVKALYAIYRFPAEQNVASPEQRGEYGLLFEHESGDQPEPVVAVVTNGKLVRLEFYPGLAVDEVLTRVPVAQVILPPQQARRWSEALQQMQIQSRSQVSPDKWWIAQTTMVLPGSGEDRYYRRLTVTGKDGAPAYTLVDEWADTADGYRMPQPLAWFGMSPTEFPILYWTNLPVMDSCPAFHNGSDLYRVDLESGTKQALLGAVGTWLAVSPDQSRAAVIGEDGLGIYDLSNGQQRLTRLPQGLAGKVVWSPDGRDVALTIADAGTDGADSCRTATTHTILRIDAGTLEVKLRLAGDPRRLVTQSWSQLGLIKLSDAASAQWLLDPYTGQVWDAVAGRPAAFPTHLAATQTPVHIGFFMDTYQEADMTAIQNLADQFAAENPGLQVIFVNPPDIFRDVFYHTGGIPVPENPPDVGVDCFANRSLPAEFGSPQALLFDLAPLLAAAGPGLSGDYWPGQLDPYRMGGNGPEEPLYGLPLFENPSLIFYNADLLEQKGLAAPALDWTFDDLTTLLDDVAAGQPGERAFGYFGEQGSLAQVISGLFAPIFDRSTIPTTARFVSPEMAAGLERLEEMRRSGALLYVPATLYAGQDYNDAAIAWQAGQLAFWQYLYNEPVPFTVIEQPPTFKVGMAPLFSKPYSVPQNFYITKNSPNSQACFEWYRFLTGHPEAQRYVPARRSMLDHPGWKALVGEANAAALRTALEQVYSGQPTVWETTMDTPLEIWLITAVTDYFNGAEAQTVMAIAQSKADAYTACIAPSTGLAGKTLSDAIVACLRQVEPGRW